MALATGLQGHGRGGALLADALARSLMSRSGGPAFRVFVVDAIDMEVAGFYRRYGFKESRNSRTKLYMKIKTIEKACVTALGEAAGS